MEEYLWAEEKFQELLRSGKKVRPIGRKQWCKWDTRRLKLVRDNGTVYNPSMSLIMEELWEVKEEKIELFVVQHPDNKVYLGTKVAPSETTVGGVYMHFKGDLGIPLNKPQPCEIVIKNADEGEL